MSKIISLLGKRLAVVNKLRQTRTAFYIRSNKYSCITAHPTNLVGNSFVEQPVILAPSYRSLYSEGSLRLESLDAHRQNIAQFYQGGDRDAYLNRIRRYLDSSDANAILLQDLINIIGLAEDEEDLDLIESLVANMKTSNQFPTTSWGSAVMRLYFKLNQLERTYKNIQNEEKFGKFFESYTSYRIAMVMFYNNKRYDEVLELYNLALAKIVQESDVSTDGRFITMTTIALAALAQQNKPNGLELAKNIYEKVNLIELKRFQKTRIVAFMAYIAYNNNQPSLAMNIISESKLQNYITLRELKTLSLIKLERFEDVLFHLRSTLLVKNDRERKNSILRDIFDLIKSKTGEIESEVLRSELLEVLDEIQKSDLIQESNLDSILFAEIHSPKRLQSEPYVSENRFQDNENQRKHQQRSRPMRRYKENSEEPFADSV